MQTKTDNRIQGLNTLPRASGAVAIFSQLRMNLNGRSYFSEPQADPPLPPNVQEIGEWLVKSFPIKGAKKEMLEKFIGMVSKLKSMHADMNTLFKAIGVCGGFKQTFEMDFPEQSVLTAELYMLDDTKLQVHLTMCWLALVGEWLKRLAKHFDFLMTVKQVGLIQWFGPKACRMSYVRCATKESATRRDRGDRIETVTVTTEIEEANTHDVIDATSWQFPNRNIPAPNRVNALVPAIPEWIRKWMTEVDGTMIHESIIPKVVGKTVTTTEVMKPIERDVNIYEPGIVFANHWVLAGWTIDEVNDETQRKETEVRERARRQEEYEREQLDKRRRQEESEASYKRYVLEEEMRAAGVKDGCECKECRWLRKDVLRKKEGRRMTLLEHFFGT